MINKPKALGCHWSYIDILELTCIQDGQSLIEEVTVVKGSIDLL